MRIARRVARVSVKPFRKLALRCGSRDRASECQEAGAGPEEALLLYIEVDALNLKQCFLLIVENSSGWCEEPEEP